MSRSAECNTDRMNVERILARGFVIAGGLFWVIAAFAGPYFYDRAGTAIAVRDAVYPFAATVAALVIGWTYERLAAIVLFAGAAGVVAWGIMFGWELGVWLLMSIVLIAPMVTASVLFVLASRMQAACARVESRTAAETPLASSSRARATHARPD
jgi:uncharacterized membrane protein